MLNHSRIHLHLRLNHTVPHPLFPCIQTSNSLKRNNPSGHHQYQNSNISLNSGRHLRRMLKVHLQTVYLLLPARHPRKLPSVHHRHSQVPFAWPDSRHRKQAAQNRPVSLSPSSSLPNYQAIWAIHSDRHLPQLLPIKPINLRRQDEVPRLVT